MIKGQCVILSRYTNGRIFTTKCLKQLVKDNKKMAYKIGDNTGIVRNFRYNKGQVIADFIFPYLDINCQGKIDDWNNISNSVTKFTINNIELVQSGNAIQQKGK